VKVLRTNEYWGRRGGSIAKDGTRVFRVKRGSSSRRDNSQPVGRSLRRKQRTGRTYANRKLSRQAAMGFASGASKRDLGRKHKAA
jgi:hypothetical protein